MSSAALKLSRPDAAIFQVPPSDDPQTVLPPPPGSIWSASAFSIPPSIYHAALDVRVPVTIASVYAVTVVMLNAYNRSYGNRPWKISRTRAFFCFVVAHNVMLALYSGWTFLGMMQAARRSVCNPFNSAGLVGMVDSLCKIHGAAGLGNAIAYNRIESKWESNSALAKLVTATGSPDTANLGRLWNEGLAFYGWLFYISKFYEVVDTAIIIAKGKRSSTLQTYHHAGAMMCMWSGIRYMSPPIWMFVLVNSFIHTLMYTYYTLSALSVPVPQSFKKALTTMQIIQLLFGGSYAALHSFISYTVPNKQHSGSQTWSCIDTTGETFAIWFNVLYLTPLTVLFLRFFTKSYFRSQKGGQQVPRKKL